MTFETFHYMQNPEDSSAACTELTKYRNDKSRSKFKFAIKQKRNFSICHSDEGGISETTKIMLIQIREIILPKRKPIKILLQQLCLRESRDNMKQVFLLTNRYLTLNNEY